MIRGKFQDLFYGPTPTTMAAAPLKELSSGNPFFLLLCLLISRRLRMRWESDGFWFIIRLAKCSLSCLHFGCTFLITDQVKKNWSGWWYGQHRCVLGLHLELPPTKLSSKVKIFTWMFKIATIRKDDVCDGFLAACKGEWQQEQRGSSTRASSMTQRPELKKSFFIFVRADLLQNKNHLTEKHSFRNALCFWLLSMSSGCWSRKWRAWLDAVDSQVGVLEVGWGRGALLRGIS